MNSTDNENNPESVVILNTPFTPIPGVKYRFNYLKSFKKLEELKATMSKADYAQKYKTVIRDCVLKDLWFITYFIMKIPIANHPFWVNYCREVQEGPDTHTLDVAARGHGKSTIITVANTIREVLYSKVILQKDETVGIFSYSQSAALIFLRQIKFILETSEVLKVCFPEALYENPVKQAYKWGEESGLYLKRDTSAKEATFEAWGLIEGMPTGRHFTKRIYDDIVTPDMVNTPEMNQKVKDAFDMSQNLATRGGTHRVIGTYYHHDDCLVYIGNKIKKNGDLLYHVRKKPATHDGTPNGEPVFLSQEELDELKNNTYAFNTQQLLDPSPEYDRSLDSTRLVKIPKEEVPNRLYKFILVDPAGVNLKAGEDSWGIICVGVVPFRDDLGNSDVIILDACIKPLELDEACRKIVSMYLKHGRISCIGVEKTVLASMEVHIANALAANGKYISEKSKTLQLFRPSGRKKTTRITTALQIPLNSSKIKYVETVPADAIETLKTEMDRFPYWHDDGIDALSYLYDLLKDYRFPAYFDNNESEDLFSRFERKKLKNVKPNGCWSV